MVYIFRRDNKETRYLAKGDANTIAEGARLMLSVPPIQLSDDEMCIYCDLDSEDIGSAIQNLRTVRNWSQTELGQLARVSLQYVSQIERNFKKPADKTYLKLISTLVYDASSQYIPEKNTVVSPVDFSESTEDVNFENYLLLKEIEEQLQKLSETNDHSLLLLTKETLASIISYNNCLNDKKFSTSENIDEIIEIIIRKLNQAFIVLKQEHQNQ